MRSLTNLSLSLLLLLLLFTHTRMVAGFGEVESQRLEAEHVEEPDVALTDVVESMIGSDDFDNADILEPASALPCKLPGRRWSCGPWWRRRRRGRRA
ncbi:unnamed protein product [Mesocestoides corti]|uniref:Secreted protein n=1 Tax=Mesocestoides corti TaxID=53468 RepID=A0A0R3UBF1_MESCO|nr:unnamed protein product [Mesocestoides corti]